MTSHTINYPNKLAGILGLLAAILFLSLSTPVNLLAQRITYPDLVNRPGDRHFYFDHFTLPTDTSDKVHFVSTFRIDYTRLRFKKTDAPDNPSATSSNGSSFKADVSVSMELFKVEEGELKRPLNRKRVEKSDIQSLTPVKRKFWKHTATASTYEQTQSSKHYISGYLDMQVSPGPYKLMVEINSESTSEKPVKRTIPLFLGKKRQTIRDGFYYLDSLEPPRNPSTAVLANFGKNVSYGKDFHLLMQIPELKEEIPYAVEIQKINIKEKDTTSVNNVFRYELSSKDLYKNIKPVLNPDSTQLKFSFIDTKNDSFAFGLVKIPNSRFENGSYRIKLLNTENQKRIHKDIYQSRWLNMPVSLLNIDVSIRMLRFIVEEEKLEKMQDGSKQDRIESFKEFWKEKDPTPQTAYNELMAEYYQRIDYSYENFSSIKQPGYETDMGKIYIRRGPPKSIERKFPSGERALEVWTYPNKTYIFRATSGFGDFELVSER